MNKRVLAFLAAFGATSIYALNHTIAKGLMPMYIKPFGFIFMRVVGAFILFWGLSLFRKSDPIEKKDWPKIMLASLFGASINMLSFFKGLELSTPINSAVLVTITPICTLVLSAILLKEPITKNKTLGIALGLVGALGLVVFGNEMRSDAPNIRLGNILFIVNALSYGAYLVLTRSLVQKYHPFTLLKWLFTFSLIINFPITIGDFLDIQWSTLPSWSYATIAFVVVGVTFLTYLFNAFAMTELKASTIGVFTYVQPVMGILFAVLAGKDQFTLTKIVAASLVIGGVYLASKRVRLPSEKKEVS